MKEKKNRRKTERPAVKRQVKSGSAIAGRRTQAERSEGTRLGILKAALGILESKGYAGFRTADVAVAAGVSRGALTHHFPSRGELLLAVVEHVFQSAADLSRSRVLRIRTPDDAIKALLEDGERFFFSELFLISMDMAIQGRTQSDGVTESIARISSETRLPVEARWLQVLVAAGIPRDVADDLLWLTLSVVRGLAMRRTWKHEEVRFKHLFAVWRRMVASYLSEVGVQSAAGR